MNSFQGNGPLMSYQNQGSNPMDFLSQILNFGSGNNNNNNNSPDEGFNYKGLNTGINGANALLNGIMGFKQYGLAKDQLNFSRNAANRNVSNQATLLNGQMEQKHLRRLANDPSLESLESFMSRNSVDGSRIA